MERDIKINMGVGIDFKIDVGFCWYIFTLADFLIFHDLYLESVI